MSPIQVVDYDPAWPDTFRQIRDVVAPVVAHLPASVEHVGSTAVPGLPAKPVIDVDVVVPAGGVQDAIAGLATLGYVHRGDLGIPGREAFRAPAGMPRHHLYVCPEGSPALANHLRVRDHLRRHPAEARAYGELKRRLAARFPDDVDAYVEGKTVFLLDILRREGFDPALVADVARQNRRRS